MRGASTINFIEELYYGNLNPSVRCFAQDSEYADAVNLVAQNEEQLRNLLEGEAKTLFQDLMEAQQAANGITAFESFADGFLLGSALIKDVFLTPPKRVFEELD